jgi:hypothetical protein
MTDLSHALTIRPAYADDCVALHRLAALDSAPAVPQGPLLLAERDGELRAALSLADGTVVADPFHPTAALVALLRVHAAAGRRADVRRLRPSPRHRLRLA